MNVALFVTCLADHYFAEAAADAVRLLGCEVTFPAAQTCCGDRAPCRGLRAGGTHLRAGRVHRALRELRLEERLEATSLPRVHVALVGIEKLLPRMSDLAGFLQLTTRAATGQAIGCFVSLIQGPATRPGDDGPEEVHVVLVDNGRTDVLLHEHAW